MRYKLPDDFRQPCHKSLLYQNAIDNRMYMHFPWAEVDNVTWLWLRRRLSVTTPEKLSKLALPADWHERTRKFMEHKVIEEVRYSKSRGVDYVLPYVENSALPALFRRFRLLWNDGASPRLELGCHFHYDSSGHWLTLSMCTPLLFNGQENWQDLRLTSYSPTQLQGLTDTGRTFVYRLFNDRRVSRVHLMTPMTRHLCHVIIGTQPGMHAPVEEAVSKALEDALGLSLIYAT